VRYRLATAADLDTCVGFLRHGFRAPPPIIAAIPEIWRELIDMYPGSLSVIEDAERSHPHGIEAFAACVFVTDAFIAAVRGSPRPYLAAQLYEQVLAGASPVLSPPAMRKANSTGGLNLLCLHFALREPDLEHPRTRAVLQVANTAFFFFFGGYRVNTLHQEVFGTQHATYLQAGGLRLLAGFGANGHEPAIPEHVRPHLFGLRKHEVAPAAVNPLSLLFHGLPPRFGFTTTAQRMLERAMLNQSDSDVAHALGISIDAVKKTWRSIYQRVDDIAPKLLNGGLYLVQSGHRSAERRRHLLEYLRTHPEELRPVERIARSRSSVAVKDAPAA
jgi:DNA-binding CsgD family transcriptional regulator